MDQGQERIYAELLEANVAELPYFRGFLRAVEARFYQAIDLPNRYWIWGCRRRPLCSQDIQEKNCSWFGSSTGFIK
jgi:hypothetical protein